MRTSIKAFVASAMILACRLGLAETYYVDQKHPQAADTNSGTAEQPWKTIGYAAKTLKAGDTVKIKSGRYREGNIQIVNSGERLRHDPKPSQTQLFRGGAEGVRISFEAEGAEPVILDGSVAIPAEAWQPVEGRKHVYAAPLPAVTLGGQAILWVYLNDRLLNPCIKEVATTGVDGKPRFKTVPAVPEDGDVELWHHDAEKKLLYMNFGGRSPATAGLVEAAVHHGAIHGGFNDFITLSGLTIQRYNGRTLDFTRASNCTIQDCLLRHCGSEALASGRGAHVRRNTAIEVNGVGIGPGSGSRVLENLVMRTYRNRSKGLTGYQNTAITFFGQDFVRLKNNVVLESPANGIWPDCRSNSHLFYGNTVGYCQSYGFYIEAPVFGNTLMNNVVFQTGAPGICLRGNLHNIVSENYIFSCKSPGISLIHTELCAFMRNNFVMGNWFRDLPTGLSVGGGYAGRPEPDHYSDRNVFDPSVKAVAHWGGKLYKTLDEFRAGTGNERRGRVEKVNEDEMGLVSFRIAESSRPWEPVLMFGNPYCTEQRAEWGDECGPSTPYFWVPGTVDGDETVRWYFAAGTGTIPFGERGGGTLFASADMGLQGYAVAATPEEKEAIKQRQRARGLPDAGALEVASSAYVPAWMKKGQFYELPDEFISERGVGFWSVSLPTAPGAVVDLRLHAQTRELKPAQPGGGMLVFAEWSDYTRRRVAREYLVGRDEQGKDHQTDKMSGTYAYQPITGAVTAPDWARRFRLFFGLRSCSGVALFDDIDTIRARPGKEGVVAETLPPVAQPKPLVDAATLDFHIVDLSKVVNRSLSDDKADDGVGGWSDQGAGCDMAGLPPGRKEYQGVPFEILKEPHNIVVLGTPWRPQSKLPEKATIEVGRKADVVYFLHDSAYTADNQENFRYVIRYADGATEAIPIHGGTHILDWAAGSQARFTRKTPGMRPSVAALLGGGLVFPEVNIYMLEWPNPHPEKEMVAIDFVGAQTGVPILLGITVGTKK